MPKPIPPQWFTRATPPTWRPVSRTLLPPTRNCGLLGYSPLDSITQENVGDLRMVWSRALMPGTQEGTPLAYGGVLYMPNPRDIIQAVDAVAGDLLWEYRRDLPDDLDDYLFAVATNRNVAIGRIPDFPEQCSV